MQTYLEFFLILPGIAAFCWLIAQSVLSRRARRKAEEQKQASAAAWVRQQKEFANFFTYDGTSQED